MTLSLIPHTYELPKVVCMPSDTLSKLEAGALIRLRREKKGLTQEQVIELAGIPTITQLSEYEAGKVGFATGKHFPGIIRALSLSPEDIEAINPAYIVKTSVTRSGTPVKPKLEEVSIPLEIAPSLQEAIDKYGDDFPEFKIEENLRVITSVQRFGGAGDLSPKEWLDILMANRRWLVKN